MVNKLEFVYHQRRENLFTRQFCNLSPIKQNPQRQTTGTQKQANPFQTERHQSN